MSTKHYRCLGLYVTGIWSRAVADYDLVSTVAALRAMAGDGDRALVLPDGVRHAWLSLGPDGMKLEVDE